MSLSGGKLAGGNPTEKRVENDYYATDPLAVEMLLERYSFVGKRLLEPCVGSGNIAEAVSKYYNKDKKTEKQIDGIDIVDRGYKGTIVQDFLTYEPSSLYDGVITNPPYSLAKEFVEKSMEVVKKNGQVAMFLKIQFLESEKREDLFIKYPPKYVYVFRNRMATWKNGLARNPETGRKWSTTMTHAWFIWEKGSNSEPVIRWLDKLN